MKICIRYVLPMLLAVVFALPASALVFKVKDMNDKDISSNDFKDKVTVFMVCNDKACKDMTATAIKLHKDYGANDKFHMLFVSRMPDKIPEAARKGAQKDVAKIFADLVTDMKKLAEIREGAYYFIFDWDKKLLEKLNLATIDDKFRIVLFDTKGNEVRKFNKIQLKDLVTEINKVLPEMKKEEKKEEPAKEEKERFEGKKKGTMRKK